jgi:hypothetical protein
MYAFVLVFKSFDMRTTLSSILFYMQSLHTSSDHKSCEPVALGHVEAVDVDGEGAHEGDDAHHPAGVA